MKVLVLGASVIVGLQSSPAGAIIVSPLPRVCNEFPHSDYVFSGKVISEGYSDDEYGPDEGARTYGLRVDRIYKGKVPDLARLITPADSGGGALDIGQPAIVFARNYKGRIAFSGSSNSVSGAGAAKVIAEIQDYFAHPPKVATIAGRVDWWPSGPMAGVRLLLTNGKSRRFVRTDTEGMFLAPVQPGIWSVRIAKPGWASRSGVYTYDFAEHLRLAKGGCADVEIETVAPGEKLGGVPHWKRPGRAGHARR